MLKDPPALLVGDCPFDGRLASSLAFAEEEEGGRGGGNGGVRLTGVRGTPNEEPLGPEPFKHDLAGLALEVL